MVQRTAREASLSRRKLQSVQHGDEEGRGLWARADQGLDAVAGKHREHHLQAAPPTLPPRRVVADLAGVVVHAQWHEGEEQRGLLDVGRDRVQRLDRLIGIEFSEVAAEAKLRQRAVVDPDVRVLQHRLHLGSLDALRRGDGLLQVVLLEAGRLPLGEPGQHLLERVDVRAVRVRMLVAQPLVRDYHDVPRHVRGPLLQEARAQELVMRRQGLHAQHDVDW
mmetsp:Transcript_62842/g.164776  ORF Transcript_62842/g.164776 Transcript_62842/m.164776 type:complete len:221 (+) Transcript_62842:1685-2347(+)